MTDTKFTPGPWRLEKKRSQFHIRGTGGQLSLELHANQYAAVANAHLIAAAPELYEACEEPARRLRDCARNIRDEFPLWAADLEKMADKLAAVCLRARGGQS